LFFWMKVFFRGLVNQLPKVGELTPKPPKPQNFPKNPRTLGVDPPNPSAGLGVGSPNILNEKTQNPWQGRSRTGGREDSSWPLMAHPQRPRVFLLVVEGVHSQRCGTPIVPGGRQLVEGMVLWGLPSSGVWMNWAVIWTKCVGVGWFSGRGQQKLISVAVVELEDRCVWGSVESRKKKDQ
jgi:hypothetical protein